MIHLPIKVTNRSQAMTLQVSVPRQIHELDLCEFDTVCTNTAQYQVLRVIHLANPNVVAPGNRFTL